MLAHHPITGQPIHILRTETQISSDLKTLVWIRSTFKKSHRWQRWFTLITEPEAHEVCEQVTGIVLTLESDLSKWVSVLPTILQSSPECLVLAPLSVIDALERTYSFSCPRVLIYEDLFDSYPYLGEPIKKGDLLEKIIISFAHILRMNRIVWSSTGDRDEMPFSLRMQYDSWAKCLAGVIKGIPANSDDSCIPQTWLFQQYFRHTSNRRSREIFTCLEKNVASPYIDNILLLNEKEYAEIPSSPKIQTILLNHRLTYFDVLTHARRLLPPGAFLIFSNSDIYFDDTLSHLWRISLLEKKLFLALLRWEDDKNAEPHIFGPRADSQDSWILSRDSLTFDITEEEFGFPFGKAGCDNAISLIMLRKRFLVVNPAYSIKTYHIHSSNVRTYDPKDVLFRPHYLYVDPTAIQYCSIEKSLDRYLCDNDSVNMLWKKRLIGKSFTRVLNGVNDSAVQTACTMLERSEQPNYFFSPGSNNLWTPPPVSPPLYVFKNVFLTASGLVSSFSQIFVGKHRGWIQGWESAAQSSLTSCIHVPNLISFPYDEKLCKSLSKWVLTYLPHVYTLRNIIKKSGLPLPEFLVPHIPEIGSFLQDCSWKEIGNITVTPMMEDINYYANTVWAVPPADDGTFVTKEDIDVLRSLMPSSSEQFDKTKPVAVFCVEDDEKSVLTREWAEETAERILPKGWVIQYVSTTDSAPIRRKAFMSASWIFGSGAVLDWLWYANPGTTVMEFMNDSSPIGDHIHLAGAAGLRYVLGLIKNEPGPFQRQSALLDVGKAIQKYGFKEILQSVRSNPITEIPTIVIPAGKGLQGMWNHSGDRFREMIQIWGAKKYVNIEQSEHTHFCWWGGIGEVLLYDQDTPRWWIDVPPYQMALFGNCAPPGPDKHRLRQSTWGFWPRAPVDVEKMNDAHENKKSYFERAISSVFLGKVENGVQRANRFKKDWSKCVELFSMPIDSTGGPYPYTQLQYLQKLCDSRFGLCLPGFGQKCNREIEYFATGCVPIVTEGVDMRNYLLPPREGIHYLRASSPEDVVRIVKDTTPEKWSEMSKAGKEWWQAVASAEGLFRLTWARVEQCRPYLNVGIPKNL